MEQEIGLEKLDAVVGLISPNLSCLEKIRVSEKLGNGINAISCTSPCLENTTDLKAQSLDAMTAFPDGENVELSSSPGLTDEEVLGCQTPTGSIFNPFAPGPEELAFAPKKKLVKESRVPLWRQLNFDFSIDSLINVVTDGPDDSVVEERLLESVYESVIEVVVSNLFKKILDENLSAELDTSESFRTPPSMHLLTGVVQTCPAAPLRHGLKSRRLIPSICWKLNF